MLTSQLNFFSFLIPTFLFSIAACIFGFGFRYKIANYLRCFACVIALAAVLQIAQSVIIPQQILAFIPLLCLLFLVIISLTVHAVYLRLNIKTRWRFIYPLLSVAFILFSYFTFIEYSLVARLSITAILSCFIFANNLLPFLQKPPQHWLDRSLKLILILLLVTQICHVLFLIFLSTQQIWDDYLNFFWASTQFTILFFSVAIFAVLCGCSIHESIRTLEYERSVDPLTGLLNRRALDERLSGLFKAHIQHQHAILLCDLDHFKRINDVYGHNIGDLALKHVTQILLEGLRNYDEVARIGGEEFEVLLFDVEQYEALRIAERLRSTLEYHPLLINAERIELNLSIGVSFFQHAEDYYGALQQADLLLYQAKKFGRNNVQWQLLERPQPDTMHDIMQQKRL